MNAKVGSIGSLDVGSRKMFGTSMRKVIELATMTLSYGIEEKDDKSAQRMTMEALWCVQDSPQARLLMRVVIKVLEGRVENMPPPKPLSYLFSVRIIVLNLPTYTDNGS
ncbi:hypothetical protein Vadar_003499 [Vaccinium darrowii]|uniref:Uncharacterized protein n=1 Tax=Vaccinium darrowii TaxID=229202 RepID=A0ACB7WXI9_9ERIC|nr:hypothetical protein Vadar_003499 [Vaccinium darrowii]